MVYSQPDGYMTFPQSGKGLAVLVLHAWWGLNDTIKAICSRLSNSGFVAFAPDLYHGMLAETIVDAESLAQALDVKFQQAKAEVASAALYLHHHTANTGSSLAVIGFSLGAYYALELSVSEPEIIQSVVVFYGTGVDEFSSSKAAYLGHFAEHDDFEPNANVDHFAESLKQANRPTAIYRYPETGHWFFEEDRIDAYNPQAAQLAWQRTLNFLKTGLVNSDEAYLTQT